ncbi:MAG: hypothetical protein IKV41_06660, partial [Oscillospiraceae bacterium]|nr:hypothetical protein [Oscillospiraceae bacterium]
DKLKIKIGGTSLISVFVLLCLAAFGTLSLSSANADYRLAQRSAAAIDEYYQADSKAVEAYAVVDRYMRTAQSAEQLKMQLADKMPYDAVVTDDDGLECSFEVPVDKNRSIYVCVKMDENNIPKLTQWKTILTGAWEEDVSMNLWDGEDIILIEE